MPLPVSALLAAAVLPVLCAMTPMTPAMAASDPLESYRWRDRVLLVVAPHEDDPALRRQKAIFQGLGAEARDRDLVLVTAIGTTPDAEALRRRFHLGGTFHALLIGKDGGAKLTSAEPVGPEALLPLIDAMPMRQDEMRQKP